eukprot:768555-Hanusia_phi.AAC.6
MLQGLKVYAKERRTGGQEEKRRGDWRRRGGEKAFKKLVNEMYVNRRRKASNICFVERRLGERRCVPAKRGRQHDQGMAFELHDKF